MALQREVNDLLTRKSSWLASDVARFTALVQEDHVNERKERDAKIEAAREEERVERTLDSLMKAILGRYHEEQIWSDKVSPLFRTRNVHSTALSLREVLDIRHEALR